MNEFNLIVMYGHLLTVRTGSVRGGAALAAVALLTACSLV